ncbi:MAG: ATPase [gamma proteobacterium symbiont of Phacoides pectinatus]
MDQTLQRLLDAEARAERMAQQADAERERIIQGALTDARAEEARFEARIPELHASFIEKAEERAEQIISEQKRRFDERHTQLRNLAEKFETEALDAAFKLLIHPQSGE